MKSVRIWLITILVSLLIMIGLGGVTRLTGSGLSITQWKPIMGAIPPLHQADWNHAFSLYQETPQFKLENSSMSLTEFKWIFFWEFIHRLFGRLIGVIVLLPLLYFTWKKTLPSRLRTKVWIGFALGGLQGLMGWIMVMSGLSERTSVSHIRLAMHFTLALFILSYFTRLYCEVTEQIRSEKPQALAAEPTRGTLNRVFRVVTVIFCLQVIYGAFVAGLKAGKAFNTFPLMAGHVIPPNLWLAEYGAWMNVIDNPATVQWVHRTLAWLLFFGTGWMAIRLRSVNDARYRKALMAFIHLVPVQFLIGVSTLLLSVPVSLGALHQFVAALLVIFLTRAHFYSKPGPV